MIARRKILSKNLTMFDDRLSRLDLRVGKRIAVTPRVRLQANFNIYNVFNGSASSTLNTNYGPLWLQPSLLQDGRMVIAGRGPFKGSPHRALIDGVVVIHLVVTTLQPKHVFYKLIRIRQERRVPAIVEDNQF